MRNAHLSEVVRENLLVTYALHIERFTKRNNDESLVGGRGAFITRLILVKAEKIAIRQFSGVAWPEQRPRSTYW